MGQVSQTPYVYNIVSLIWASKYPTLHMNAHKITNSLAPNSNPKWCEAGPIQPITKFALSMHPFQANTLQLTTFGSHNNHFILSLVH